MKFEVVQVRDSEFATGRASYPYKIDVIKNYMPDNFQVFLIEEGNILCVGRPVAGWDAENYVVPRLRSGFYACKNLDCDTPAFQYGVFLYGQRYAREELWREQQSSPYKEYSDQQT